MPPMPGRQVSDESGAPRERNLGTDIANALSGYLRELLGHAVDDGIITTDQRDRILNHPQAPSGQPQS
jgi:hypothetical protein